MGDAGNHPLSAGRLVARRSVALLAAACVFTSCSGEDQPRKDAAPPEATASSPAASPAPTTSTPTPEAETPAPQASGVPTDPTALAGQLDQAIATLRDRSATDDDVRQAGEFHQLAVRALSRGSDGFGRKVIAGLTPEAAQQVRGDVRASRLLTVITEPKPRFPPWRIVTPPPVSVLLGYYREAERRTGVPWTYLAAIHLVETRMGRIRGPSTAGALGPMQFLPSTWDRFGEGGDINDPRDAINAAARLLAAYGAPGDMAGALWHYNPSSRYVGAVTEYARSMQRSRAAYRGYWHWRVLYRHARGTYVLPVGYPAVRPVLMRAG